MIQRIQSIFLLLAGLAAFSLFKLPFANTAEAQADSALFADTLFNIQDNGLMLGLFVLCGVLLLATIFLFNNRQLQMKLTLASLLIALVASGLMAFHWMQDAAAAIAQPAAGVAMPLLILIFSVLAHRFIKKDENLVRSTSRLRD